MVGMVSRVANQWRQQREGWSDRARDEHFAAIGPDLHAKLADVVATFVTARMRL
jgi:hypothetical protein